MAELIPTEDISELKSAAEVKEIATEAISIHEKNSVARTINLAANAGQHEAVWMHALSDSLKEELEGLGYIVVPYPGAADPNKMYKIMGF